MADTSDHGNHVNTWMRQAAKGLSAEQLLELSEIAMTALWKRAYVTLGEITLIAITDRVLFTTAENFPALKSLKATRSGIDWRELRKQHRVLSERELAEGVRFLVAEFMLVVGNLTAEMFTAAFHAELSKVALERPAIGDKHKERQS